MNTQSVKYLFKEGLKNIWNNRIMSFASICVLLFCLLLTGGAMLFSLNISSALDTVEKQNNITVYLDTDLSNQETIEAGNQIKAIPNVISCEFFSKAEAMEKYQEVLGDLFDDLQGEDNPLPDAFHVSMEDLSLYDDTVNQIENLPGISSISDRRDIAQKLTGLNHLVATIGVWILIVLSAVSLFIISNTISITMYSRRLEISIMKSVGATDLFIQIPFLVEGIAIGILSALLATGGLSLMYQIIISSVNQIVPFVAIKFSTLVMPILTTFLSAGILFGIIGGSISIRKYLKKGGGDIIGI